MYSLTLTADERRAFDWVGDRYKSGKVADLLIGCIPEEWDWDDDGEIKSPVEWVRRQGTIYELGVRGDEQVRLSLRELEIEAVADANSPLVAEWNPAFPTDFWARDSVEIRT
jgi:hypothetical protein